MMTNLVSEKSHVKILSRKRPYEYGTSGARFLHGSKHPRFSAIRQFPPRCGAAACKVGEACNEGGVLFKTSNEMLEAGPRKPVVEKLPAKLNSDESMKPLVEMLQNELKSELIKAPILHGNTFLKSVEMGLLKDPEKVELINTCNNNSIPKPIKMLCGSNTSPRPFVLSKRYPPPNFRKGVTIFRDFPRGSGRRNPDMSSKCGVLPDDKSIDAELRMFQADKEKFRNGAKSWMERNDSKENSRYKLSEGHTGAKGGPVMNEFIDVAHSDTGIVPATQQGVKTSNFIAATGATDGCGGEKCNIIVNNEFQCLLLKHFDTNSNFLNVEAGRYNALKDQKHNIALSVKQSDHLTISGHHETLNRTKSREVLDLFEQILKRRLLEIQLEEKSMGKKKTSTIYTEIAMQLKKQKKWIYMNQKLLGAIPGVEVGDTFRYRAELVIVGLHVQFFAGIDYLEKDGKKIAISIVSSGRYFSNKEFPDKLIYSGEGGNQIMGDKKFKDQALVRGNLALKNSMDEETPVRVIRGRRAGKSATFTYDGLYFVSKFWQERAQSGKLVYLFQLNRMQGQPKLKLSTLQRVGKSKARHSRALINDISSGNEKISIRVVNDIDNDKPPTFNYITKMAYPQLHISSMATSGCHCIDGCSDRVQCSCIIKNGGMVPYNENGALLEAKPTTIVYECGS